MSVLSTCVESRFKIVSVSSLMLYRERSASSTGVTSAGGSSCWLEGPQELANSIPEKTIGGKNVPSFIVLMY